MGRCLPFSKLGTVCRAAAAKTGHDLAIEQNERDEVNTVTLRIPTISCGHCLMTIKREASLVTGVQFVGGDIASKTATFQVASDVALANLKKALEQAGYAPA